MSINSSLKTNLLNFNHADMKQFFVELDDQPFRATQLLKWIHQVGKIDFSEMTNFSKSLRHRLTEIAEIKLPEIAREQSSRDGTHKWLLRLADGNCIETVFIPQKDRGTLCVSSQVGCALDCSFCATGKQGFSRNLTVAEIIGQVWIAVQQLSKNSIAKERVITNVVMMGMGEPLLNFEAVVKAMDIMMDDNAYNLSKYRVTLSTSGVIPLMQRLKEQSPVALAVSLHAPTNILRDSLVPLNKKYPLEELIPICKNYFGSDSRRKIIFEYVMLDGVNDSKEQAKQLIKLLQDVSCKINLIPFNPFPNTQYRRSSDQTIAQFQTLLMSAGFNTIVRRTRGEDVDAACGQLVGQVEDRTRRTEMGRARRKIIPIRVEHPSTD